MRGRVVGAVLAVTLVLPAGCANDDPAPTADGSRSPGRTSDDAGTTGEASAPPDPPTPAERRARAAYARLSAAQRIGQLFVVGVSSRGATPAEVRVLRGHALGNVFLRGHSRFGRSRTAAVTRRLAPLATYAGVRPWVATDQEGGRVQGLAGAGFTPMPPALVQGHRGPAALRARARTWADQLRLAGVNLDLAPVADVVPRGIGVRNQPIGRYQRQLGYRSERVAALVPAFVSGMADRRVATTLKHFPGLGRATGNTDHAAGVTEPTGRGDRRLRGFRAGIAAGAAAVMLSSARYPRLDGRQACFSPLVIRTLLRGDLGFTGLVVSDSMDTAAVRHLSPATRAVRFLRAGGTLVLDVDPRDLPPMVRAVAARVRADPDFARTVRSAVLTALRVKAEHGLVAAR